jgi:porin
MGHRSLGIILHPSHMLLVLLTGMIFLSFMMGVSAGETEQLESPWLWSTPQLTGDWLGTRSRLADSGLTLVADNTSFYVGNTTGGVRRDFDFGGHGDYVLTMDCGKLGIKDGMYVKVRAEHRFGETIVNDVGCFISPTLIADLPVFGSEQLYLTNVLITQVLSDSLAVFAGKMDTLDGDMNAFAHGRGKTQFSNMAFVFNPIVGATVPYSTLGAGFVILDEQVPLFTFSVLNSTDTTNTSGFKQLFNDGVLLSASLRVSTAFAGMPGHQLLGATWNNQTYTSISEPYIPYPNVAIPTTRGSWSLFWNFDQFLVVDSEDQSRGWGTFGRAGIADDKTSPLAWFLSFGIGGNVPTASRPTDTFGVGWYYASTSNQIGPLITAQFGPIGNGQGIECYYNYQLTPAIRLTPDLQWIVPALKSFDASVIVGLRAQLIF